MFFCKLANQDIRFLNSAYKCGQICGIIPFYKFEKFSNTHRNFKNIQAVVYITLGLLATLHGLYCRFEYFAQTYSIVYFVVNYIKEFFLVMTVLSAIMSASFHNQEHWMILNNHLQYLDEIFKRRDIKNSNFFFHLQLIFYFWFYIIYLSYVIYIHIVKLGLFKFAMFWFNELAFGIDSVLHFFMFNLALGLYSRYHELNKLFKKTNITLKSTRRMEHISRILSEATQSYNTIFGWPLLFTSGKCVTHLLQWFMEVVNFPWGASYNPYDGLVNGAFAIYTLVK